MLRFAQRIAMPLPHFTEWTVSAAKKAPLLDFLLDGLRASGCTVLYVSGAAKAPFYITFETAEGVRHGILVYAFFANSVVTRNRPDDEHRFQIKYGSDRTAVLALEQDPSQLLTTLCVGIDPARGHLVGIDPVLHDQTPMFISVEYKRRHSDAIAQKGWAAWERTSARRTDEPVEVVVGVRQDRLLDYIQFERLAVGLDQGHRQLLAEQVLGSEKAAGKRFTTHALLSELELPDGELFDLIQGARRLKMAVRGWVAERHLERQLSALPGVEACHRIDDEGQPDVQLFYRGRGPILVECKNVLRERTAAGLCRVDFQRTRASKADPCSRYYSQSDFSVLAACLHAVTERWEFRFALTTDLPAHGVCPGRIQSNLKVDGSWLDDPTEALKRACAA